MFRASGESAAAFPEFDSGYLVDYDKYYNRYRLYVRNAFRDDLPNAIRRCEELGYRVQDFLFDPNRASLEKESVAVEIGCQDYGFFEDSAEKTWKGNEHRRVKITDGAAIVEAANQYIFVSEIAQFLKRFRSDLEWKPVATIDKYDREFVRLVPRPEHSFLSSATLLDGHWVFRWVAAAAEPPDDLFFDQIATGFEYSFHPLIASLGTALELERKFPGFPFTPVLPYNSETGKAVLRVCELLKPGSVLGK